VHQALQGLQYARSGWIRVRPVSLLAEGSKGAVVELAARAVAGTDGALGLGRGHRRPGPTSAAWTSTTVRRSPPRVWQERAREGQQRPRMFR
jgi:hypothetical protein